MAERRAKERLRDECFKIAGILDALDASLASAERADRSSVDKMPSIVDLKRYCHWLELQKSLDLIFEDPDE
jgi:hypothetical protein